MSSRNTPTRIESLMKHFSRPSAPSAVSSELAVVTTPDGRSLTRRELLGGIGAVAIASAVPTVVIGSRSADAAVRAQVPARTPGKGVLVMLTMYGGNDGLNTIVPTADAAYTAVRGATAVDAAQTLRIDDRFGFHPSLVGVKALFDQGKIGIVPGVGYPTPNRSHFRSMDIWQSAVPDRVELTGWLGRWHDATGPDPIRMLSIGPSVPRALVGTGGGAGAIPNGNFNLPGGAAVTNAFTEAVRNPSKELGGWGARVASTGADLLRVSAQVGPALKGGSAGAGGVNLEGAASTDQKISALDRQFTEVATLIKANLPTRVFSVSLGGFDTHANELGNHADLLGVVDRGISKFLASIAGDPRANDVTVVVYSEFGRRVAPNLSYGTDHGTSGPVIVAGHGVRGGMHADYPSLTDLADGDLRVTTDFRRVYSTVLEQVLGADPAAVLGKRYDPLGFL